MSSNLLKSSKKITVGTSSNGYFQFFTVLLGSGKEVRLS